MNARMRKTLGDWSKIAALLLFGSVSAAAQDYPNRAISWVVPYAAGGITDNASRTIAKQLGEELGQPVVVENKPGAGGIVGAEYVAHAKPDGYTLLYTANGIVATYPYLYKKLSYDPQRDFTPLHGVQKVYMLVVVRADSPFKTLADLIAYGKKNPGKLNYATIGTGSVQHLFGELLQKEAGFKMTAIPYKGLAPALNDLLGGSIDITLDYPITMKDQIEAGKVRALAISGEQRAKSLPDVKTVAELNYPNAAFTAFTGVVLPKGIPADVLKKLAAAFDKVMSSPQIVKYMVDQGADTMPGMGPEKYADFLAKERTKMKSIVEQAGIEPE